jgi:hypothetical protein
MRILKIDRIVKTALRHSFHLDKSAALSQIKLRYATAPPLTTDGNKRRAIFQFVLSSIAKAWRQFLSAIVAYQ